MSDSIVPLAVLAVLLVVGAVAAGVVVLRRRRATTRTKPAAPSPEQTRRLRADRGSELTQPDRPGIRTLTDDERQRYVAAWEGVQRRAEGLPALALCEADAVVDRLLRDCGFPLDDPRAALDVVPGRHAEVLARFRAGHAIEQITTSSRVDAEAVRQAMGHFRAAFDAVVGEGTPAYPDAPTSRSPQHAASRHPHPGR